MRDGVRHVATIAWGSASSNRILRAVLLLCIVVVGGAVGFMVVEGWGFWQALFFTLITITTVGYGAEGLTQAGERFTTLLLVGGIGTATYAFSVIVQTAVGSQLGWRRRMQRKIDRLRDHFIICGFGRIGRTVCEELQSASVSLVIVDADADAYQRACDQGYLAVRGKATEDEVLQQAGIARAKGIVCAVDSDSDNIVIALGAREMSPDITIIARVEEDGAARKIRRAGATHVVSPSRTGGVDIAHTVLRPHVANLMRRTGDDDGDFELNEVVVEKGSFLDGHSPQEWGKEHWDDIVAVAVRRSDGTTQIRPGGGTVFQAGDILIIAGSPSSLDKIYNRAIGHGSQAA